MAEGGGLLNRYTLVKAYRGFESLRLRHSLPSASRSFVTRALDPGTLPSHIFSQTDIQRGGSPTAHDRVLATRYGVHACDMVAAGEFGKMALTLFRLAAVIFGVFYIKRIIEKKSDRHLFPDRHF